MVEDEVTGYDVYIRKNSTGEVRRYHYDHDWVEPDENGTGSYYLWGPDGNNGCDCNLANYFARAGNEDDPDPRVECGESRYKIEKIVLPSGEVVDGDDLEW